MDKVIKKIISNIVKEYRQDRNVLGVMLFGSAARNKFDQYSDIDVYILLSRKGKFSRKNFISQGRRIDIIADTVKEAKSYLKEDKNNVKRNTSHMLAYGKIFFQRSSVLKKIQRIAKDNLLLDTKHKNSEILMHKYSIDDFWGEVQRDVKSGDVLAFGLDGQLLLDNILELFLKINGTFFRQPNEMMKTLRKLDAKFADSVRGFYAEKSIQKKKKILGRLAEYVYGLSGGKMPDSWSVR